MNGERRKFPAGCAILLGLGIVVLFGLIALRSQFRASTINAQVRTAFGELIGLRLKSERALKGVILVPVDPPEWKDEPGPFLKTVLNDLPHGAYRYTVSSTGVSQTFVVVDSSGKEISRGQLPRELMTGS